MKILWIINTLITQISDACNLPHSNDSGWLSSFFDTISSDADCRLTVCFPHNKAQVSKKIDSLKFVSFSEKSLTKYDRRLEVFFEKLIAEEKPDIIHIFGTEFPHTLAAVKACESNNVLEKCVISIQGLISACAKEYCAGLPKSAIYRFSLRDFLKADNVYFQKKSFRRRGGFEILALKTAKNVIGRTDWDRSYVKSINENINYLFCNESLRSEFYSEQKWNYENCEKHSIFVTQSYYPLKGFHNLMGVFAKLAEKYPDIHIYTTGNGGEYGNYISNLRHRTYYQKYLTKMICRYNLCDKITFLGNLNSNQMRDRYLKSNVFLLCSSIENSSNSLGEAMILGVPCVASDVGGIKSLINHNTEGFLYPFDRPEAAAGYIDNIFSDVSLADKLSSNAREHALNTHSKEINCNRLKEIYNTILENKGEI